MSKITWKTKAEIEQDRINAGIESQKQEEQIAAEKTAIKISMARLITADSLTDKELEKVLCLFDEWSVGVVYAVGNIVSYNGKLYEAIQSHTSQADWTPNLVSSLFKSHAPVGIIPDFVQPTGGHDAYNIGDKVLFGGSTYESLINANVWSPTNYPQGWKLI